MKLFYVNGVPVSAQQGWGGDGTLSVTGLAESPVEVRISSLILKNLVSPSFPP